MKQMWIGKEKRGRKIGKRSRGGNRGRKEKEKGPRPRKGKKKEEKGEFPGQPAKVRSPLHFLLPIAGSPLHTLGRVQTTVPWYVVRRCALPFPSVPLSPLQSYILALKVLHERWREQRGAKVIFWYLVSFRWSGGQGYCTRTL